jgi:hypothetical protein
MLQCRLGPPRRPIPVVVHRDSTNPRTRVARKRERERERGGGGREGCWDVNCFQSRAKLARKCSTRVTSARARDIRARACVRACLGGGEVAGAGRGRVDERARMFLDSAESSALLRARAIGDRGCGRRGGKIHYLSHSGARALSGAI